MRLMLALCLASLAAGPTLAAAPAKKPAKPAAPAGTTRAQAKAQVKQVFGRADTNKDGFIDHAEFRVRMGVVLNRTPPGTPGAPTKAEADRMIAAADAAFKSADTSGDGKLDLAESSVRPLALFDKMDTNHDGVLTRAEQAAGERAAVQQAAQSAAPRSNAKLEPGR